MYNIGRTCGHFIRNSFRDTDENSFNWLAIRLAGVFSHKKAVVPKIFHKIFLKQEWLWADVLDKDKSQTALRLCLLREYTTFITESGWQDKWTLPQMQLFDSALAGRPVAEVKRWNLYVPRIKKKSYLYKLRRGFHYTKRHSQKEACYSEEMATIKVLLDNFTVEDPLFVLDHLYPYPDVQSLTLAIRSGKLQKKKCVTKRASMLVYVTLNIYFNWIKANYDQFVITNQVPASSVRVRHNGDLRCSHCNKCQTFRSSLKKGNPRHNGPKMSEDMMKFVSCCCSAKLIFVPFTVGDANYVIYTPIKQMYTNCISCGEINFSEVNVQYDYIKKCPKCLDGTTQMSY